jgi:hypothetical protein
VTAWGFRNLAVLLHYRITELAEPLALRYFFQSASTAGPLGEVIISRSFESCWFKNI